MGLLDVDGRPIATNKKPRIAMGNTNPKNVIRQPPRPAMKPTMGAPIRYDNDMPAMTQPIALARFSREKCSPTSVEVIGITRAIANPVRE